MQGLGFFLENAEPYFFGERTGDLLYGTGNTVESVHALCRKVCLFLCFHVSRVGSVFTYFFASVSPWPSMVDFIEM